MRTGAIFARGSCRALKWLALFGVVFALGSGQALAQTVEGAWYNVGDNPDDSGVSVVTVKMSAEVMISEGTGDIFGDFKLGGTAGTATNLSTTASDEFTVTFGTAAISGTPTLTYTPSTTAGAVILEGSGGRDMGELSATVMSAVPDLPSAINPPPALVGLDFSFEAPDAMGGVGDITYSIPAFNTADVDPPVHVDGELPEGLEFDAETRMITGKPTTAGRFPVTLTATDDASEQLDGASDNHTDTADFFIDVSAPPALTVTLSADPMTIMEGGTSMITATASRMVATNDGAVTINLAVVGAATLSDNTITIAEGDASGSVTLTSTADADYVDHTVTVTATGTGITGSQNVEIMVEDPAPPADLVVTLSADPMTIMEGGTSMITAMANRMVVAGDGAVTVTLSVVGEATLSVNSIMIAAGMNSGSVTLTSTADADYVDDTVTVVARGSGITDDQQIEIMVEDPAPPADLVVTVTADPMTIMEGGTSTITAMASRMVAASDGAVTVSLGVVGEATLSAESITIAAGMDSGSVTLTSTADADHEADTVTVVATGSGITGSQNVEIMVEDPAPPADLVVTVSANPMTIMEGGTSTITAMANRIVAASDGAVTVSLGVVGEATLSVNSITIAAGMDSGSVTLTSTADADHEDDTVTVVATGSGITGSQNVEITVEDPAPPADLVVTVSANPMMIEEGDTSTITAMANRMVAASDGTVTINLSVVGDATLSASSITIAAGMDSGTVTLTSTDDSVYGEDDETVTVTASGDGITGNQTVEITVTDDDQAPVLPDLKGQITDMKVIGASTSDKTIGGVKRVHVPEGAVDAEVSVTVQWDHAELTALHDAGVKSVRIWLELQGAREIEQIYALPDWLSWIDDEGDVDFPNATSRLGELGAWFLVPLPARPTDFPNSIRHHESTTEEMRLLIHHDEHEAENDAFYVEATYSDDVDLEASDARNLSSPLIVIEDDEEQKVTVKRGKSSGPTTLYESVGSEDFTIAAVPPRIDLPLTVRLDVIDVGDTTVKAATFSLSQANLTLNAGRDGTGNSADVTIRLPNPDGNREDDDFDLNASVVLYSLSSGGFDTIKVATHEIRVLDIHNLPPLTVVPTSAEVMEDGELELTLTVNRNPADTIATDPETRRYTSEALTINVATGGDATMGSDYSLSSTAVMVEKHDGKAPWTQAVKVKVEVAEDNDVEPAEMLELGFTVNGSEDAKNGPRPATKPAQPPMASAGPGPDAEAALTLTDKTDKLVSVKTNAYDVIQAALGTPPTLMTGMSAELMGSNLFDYDANAVSVAYATSVDGMAVTASASGGTVTIMGASTGEAKVTITATATPNASSLIVNQTKDNVAQLTFPVMVEDAPLTFQVMGPDDMNLVEGGMGGMVKVMTNRPVSENTEVMLMRDGSSSAGEDDYMLDPPLVTIMAGASEGHTMVMAVEDGMMENAGNMPEMLTLFLAVDGMQMTDKSVSFYLWDAAVPALPIIAQLLLAAFLAVGGYRRYRRR